MPLTNEQKETVRAMRKDGYGYVSIAKIIGASRNQVRDYCRTKNVMLFGDRIELGLIPCKCCTKLFQPTNTRHKYCSDKCRYKTIYKSQDIQYYCTQCKKVVKSGRTKFCSEECKTVYNTSIRQCIVCNRNFETTSKSKKFCSSKCRGEHRIEQLGIRITRNCIQCEKEFITTKRKDGKYCSPKCNNEYKRKSHSQFAKELFETYGGLIVPLEIYKGSDNEIDYKCLKCGEVGRKKAGNLLGKYKKGCGACYGFTSRNSKGAVEIEQFLKRKGLQYEKEYGFDELKMKNRLLYDFALINNGSVTMLIEYDGRQHFEPVEKWGGEEEFERIQTSDSLKNLYAKENNIPLIRIKYDCEDIETELERKLKQI